MLQTGQVLDDMQELRITHRNENMKDGITYYEGHQARLLHKEDSMEAVVEVMTRGTIGYLYSIRETGVEFNYILRGSMEINMHNEKVVLVQGDTFSYSTIKSNIMFRVLEDMEYLSVSTEIYYDHIYEDQQQLTKVLKQLQAVDGDTMDHCVRVKNLSMGIIYYMEHEEIDLDSLFYAASFHDVGKSKIPLDILLKPGRLTDEEYQIMKTHSLYSYEMIKEQYGETVALIVFEHHEHLDGRGYPRGLKGEQIGLSARIICVADAYDAMVISRPYRKGLSMETALTELHRCEGTQFDGRVVHALELYLKNLG